MLFSLGQTALWQQAQLCPCRNASTGGANVKDPVCGGTGYLWAAPIACSIAVEGMTTHREYAMTTECEKGDLVATLPSNSPAYQAGEYDRLTLTQSSIRLNHILVRGTNDKLRYRSPIAIAQVFGLVNGVKTLLLPTADYTLSGQTIVWNSPRLPVGSQYSVLYTANPEYFVYKELVMDRPHGGRSLPRKVHLRLMELFGRAIA
ncbi:MAG: hypothetical protein Q7U76_13060 [Nitrospirota bacterium]|nr:hypothetical protein [Nitrospirota bacterium]